MAYDTLHDRGKRNAIARLLRGYRRMAREYQHAGAQSRDARTQVAHRRMSETYQERLAGARELCDVLYT